MRPPRSSVRRPKSGNRRLKILAIATLCLAPLFVGAVVSVASNGRAGTGEFAVDPPVPPSPGAGLNSGEFDELTASVPQRPGVDGAIGSDEPALADVPVEGATDGRAVVRNGPSGALNGIPRGVFPAYKRATANLAVVRPDCGLTWPLLAGVGKVESNHAAGGKVDVTGTTRGRILGPILNGKNGVGMVRDTDKGQHDRDTYWDRPVGPMQVIPTVWEEFGADGNGDGYRNPGNVYDAVTTVAVFLCADDHDLKDPRDLVRALLMYSHSKNFVSTVLRWMRLYSVSAVLVPNAAGDIGKADRDGNAERKVDPRVVPELEEKDKKKSPSPRPSTPSNTLSTRPTPLEPTSTLTQTPIDPRTPTWSPTQTPTRTPTKTPTKTPTHTPTQTPTHTPTHTPTVTPTGTPTGTPTDSPTDDPPSGTPSTSPSSTPCTASSEGPTTSPEPTPSCQPEVREGQRYNRNLPMP